MNPSLPYTLRHVGNHIVGTSRRIGTRKRYLTQTISQGEGIFHYQSRQGLLLPLEKSSIFGAKRYNLSRHGHRRWKATTSSSTLEGKIGKSPAIVKDVTECSPLGRPAMTQAALEYRREGNYEGVHLCDLESLVTSTDNGSLQFSQRSPKLKWNGIAHQWGLENMQCRHEFFEIDDDIYHHKVVALTIFPNPNDKGVKDNASSAYCYEKLRDHPHVGSHPDYDWIELVSIGIAKSKRHAEQLAALDQIYLWKEATGIDMSLGPDESLLQAEKDGISISTTTHDLSSCSAFEAKYLQCKTTLDLLGCLVYFSVDKVGANSFAADVEIFWKGGYYSCFNTLSDDPMSRSKSKSQARRQAIVSLFEQNKDTPLMKAAEAYRPLLKDMPGLVSALRIPHWKEGLAADLESSLDAWEKKQDGTAKDDDTVDFNDIVKRQYPTRWKRVGDGATDTTLLKREQVMIRHFSENNPRAFQYIRKFREGLPIAQLRQQILDSISSNNVVLIETGTGTGKSTQIPQYILEEAFSSDTAPDTRIVVTQPRKIAAKSLAERVAFERFQPAFGSGNSSEGSYKYSEVSHRRPYRSVGYSVRFESKRHREEGGTIEYVTAGLFLRRLLHHDNDLEGVSHLLIDEVHERDLETDILLLMARDILLRQQKQNSPHKLKVVLLSATLGTTALAKYFTPVQEEIPIISLPSKPLHPVKVWYLEDLLSNIDNEKFQAHATSLLEHNDRAIQQELNELERTGDPNTAERIEILENALSLRESYEDGLISLSDNDSSDEDSSEEDNEPLALLSIHELKSTIAGLVSELALHLCKEEISQAADGKKSGSILCFLPGMDDIKWCASAIERDCPAPLLDKITILPLHSDIPHSEQVKVFKPAKHGTVKVILSTNVAETSLTIDDVVAVIDSGLVKEPVFDAAASMTTIETSKISKASAIQRLGRVGRVAPGACYRIFSRADLEIMEDEPTPALQTQCLEGTCLQASQLLEKQANFRSVRDFLCNTMDPPSEDTVNVALERLDTIGAIVPSKDKNGPERLTFLGQCLVKLPLDPSIGKMLVMGSVMKCLDPLLTAAAWLGAKQLVFSPPTFSDHRNETVQRKKSFSETSDILGIINAYDSFFRICKKEGWNAAKNWCRENHINPSVIQTIQAIRKQILAELVTVNLVDRTDMYRRELSKEATINIHGDCELLVGSLLCTAVPNNFAARNRLSGKFRNVRSLTTAFKESVRLHPSSVLCHRKLPKDEDGDPIALPGWYSYHTKLHTSDVFIKDCSSVLPEQILMFGGNHLDTTKSLSIENCDNVRGIMDEWIIVQNSDEENINLLLRTREIIKALLERKLLRLSANPFGKMSSNHRAEEENDNLVVSSIRKFFDELETNRIPENDRSFPNMDFHDYYLEEGEVET